MFINETPFDSALIKEMGKRYHLTIIRFTVFLSVLLLALGIINVVRDNMVSGIIFIVLSPVLLLVFHVIIPLTIRLRTEPDAAMKEAVARGVIQTITFDEDYFNVTTTAFSDGKTIRNDYKTINKVIQTRKYIIFDLTFQGDDQFVSLGLLKSGMLVGDAHDLFKFLQEKIERNKRPTKGL